MSKKIHRLQTIKSCIEDVIRTNLPKLKDTINSLKILN